MELRVRIAGIALLVVVVAVTCLWLMSSGGAAPDAGVAPRGAESGNEPAVLQTAVAPSSSAAPDASQSSAAPTTASHSPAAPAVVVRDRLFVVDADGRRLNGVEVRIRGA